MPIHLESYSWEDHFPKWTFRKTRFKKDQDALRIFQQSAVEPVPIANVGGIDGGCCLGSNAPFENIFKHCVAKMKFLTLDCGLFGRRKKSN